MTDEIRRAMEARLAALEGSEARRARIRARIQTMERKEEPVMKRKLSVVTALAVALVLLGGTALAAGLGLNLFEYFGSTYEHWARLAERSVLETEAPFTVEHEKLGNVEAKIINAYYDGQQLLVAYAIQEGRKFALWTPTEEEKAKLTLDEWAPGRELYNDFVIEELGEEQAKAALAAREAVEAGQPLGFSTRWIDTDGLMANGALVRDAVKDKATLEDGTRYSIMDFCWPLPEVMRNQDELEVRMQLTQLVSYYWFDGTDWYFYQERLKPMGFMTATVARDTAMEIRRLEGSGEVNGVPVTVTAELIGQRGNVTVTADEEIFQPVRWKEKSIGCIANPWRIQVTDAEGSVLYVETEFGPRDTSELRFPVLDTDEIVGPLTVNLYESPVGTDASEDEAAEAGVIITLAQQ